MSVVAPKLFQSSDTAAPRLSGTVGDLIGVLDACLILLNQFTGISGGSFVDNTTEAKLAGGTAFKLFQGPTVTNDEAYFGLTAPFERIALKFGTAGVQGSAVTLAVEFWNGSAWAAVSGLTDGTSGLTADGAITWTIPGTWAKNAVNSVTCYWIRLRFTAGTWSTNPLVNAATIVGWQKVQTGTNQADYQMGGGNQMILSVNDNGPGAGGAQEARIKGFETSTGLGTGTNPFPTVAQMTNGLFARKSAAANTTARSWLLIADDRTFYLVNIPADSSNYYTGIAFGDFYSFVTSDPYRTMIMGRSTENTAVANNNTAECLFATNVRISNQTNTSLVADPGAFIVRPYTAAVGAATAGKVVNHLVPAFNANAGTCYVNSNCGNVPYVNAPDGGGYVAQHWLFEGSSGFRGRLRGLWGWGHAYNAVADRFTFNGAGVMAGKSFILVQPGMSYTNNISNPASALALETSDTWETN